MDWLVNNRGGLSFKLPFYYDDFSAISFLQHSEFFFVGEQDTVDVAISDNVFPNVSSKSIEMAKIKNENWMDDPKHDFLWRSCTVCNSKSYSDLSNTLLMMSLKGRESDRIHFPFGKPTTYFLRIGNAHHRVFYEGFTKESFNHLVYKSKLFSLKVKVSDINIYSDASLASSLIDMKPLLESIRDCFPAVKIPQEIICSNLERFACEHQTRLCTYIDNLQKNDWPGNKNIKYTLRNISDSISFLHDSIEEMGGNCEYLLPLVDRMVTFKLSSD